MNDVTYCYYSANQGMIGWWNKELSLFVVWNREYTRTPLRIFVRMTNCVRPHSFGSALSPQGFSRHQNITIFTFFSWAWIDLIKDVVKVQKNESEWTTKNRFSNKYYYMWVPLAEQNSTAASSGIPDTGFGTSFMRAKLANYTTWHYICTLKCEMHSIQNIWLQLIFTAARSRNRTTITNKTFVPHNITSFPEWIRTRRPTIEVLRKSIVLNKWEMSKRWYFWVVEICQEATEVPLA